METTNASENYRYDAFISYRHLPLDMAVAARLQELLENYNPPKNVEGLRQQQISRIFRDTSELPTSGDLGNDIREALKSSRYLIVICSEHIRESRWCMEEISFFKQYHKGRNDHILPLLISGEPGDVFPEQLLTETRTVIDDDGREHTYEADVEPLCADVRADTAARSLKLLKTEFLRIAAPILGCSFDTLYQRHLRRKKRNNAIALSLSLVLLSLVLLIVSLFAYQTWVSERAYRETLAEIYMLQGSEQVVADQPQQALMYFSQALSAVPEGLPAAYGGAALLLQEYAWPIMDKELPGTILDGEYCPYAWALADLDGEYYLRSSLSSIEICDGQGNLIREIGLEEGEYGRFLTSFGGQWSFQVTDNLDSRRQRLLLYDPAADRLRTVEAPVDSSRYHTPEDDLTGDFFIAAIGEDQAAVTGAGLVRLLQFDGDGNAQNLYTADLADAFPLTERAQNVSSINNLWVSDDGSLIAVQHLSGVAVYETDGLVLRSVIDTGGYIISDVVFGKNDTLVIVCGNPYSFDSYVSPGGMFGIYRSNGEVVYRSELDKENMFLGAAFSPENDELLLVWSQNMAAVFDISQERFLTAPVYCPNIASACFYEESSICVQSSVAALAGKQVSVNSLVRYQFIELPEQEISPGEVQGQIVTRKTENRRSAGGPDGKNLVCDGKSLMIRDSGGNTLASRELPVRAVSPQIALSADDSVAYVGDSVSYSGLLLAPIDFSENTIGEFSDVDTDGGEVYSLWTLGNCGAAETSSRRIMVFRPDGERIFSAVPRHNAVPMAMVTDPQQRCVAVYLEETITEEGVAGFEQNGYIEVWDIASGLMIADYEIPGKRVQALAITADGMLIWDTGSRAYSRIIPAAAPGPKAQQFISSLCSLTLNDRQESVSQIPVKEDLAKDDWDAALGGWQHSSFYKEETADETLLAAAVRLSGLESAGTAEWIEQCDGIWKDLAEGRLTYTISELDTFFEVYSVLASNCGETNRIGSGLQTYLALTAQTQQESEEVVSSMMNSYILPILCETTAFDEIIAAEFLDMAAYNETDIMSRDESILEKDEMEIFLWEELDRPLLLLSTHMLNAWAACLTGEDPTEEWLAIVEVCQDRDGFGYSRGEASAVIRLLEGDPDGAAEAMNEGMAKEILGMSEEEKLFLSEYFTEHLELIGVLLYRDRIVPETANEYLERLNVDFGLQVAGVGAAARESGFQLGDVIVSINGQRITSRAHARRLLSETDAECIVKREGKTVVLPVSQGLTYTFFSTIR